MKKTVKKWPKLYDKTKKGQVKVWEVRVESLYGDTAIVMYSGLKDGKMKISSKDITQGKNIGKKNETTITQQAILEAGARWQKKVDKGMVEDESKIGKKINYFPMLAKTAYSPWSSDVVKGLEKITTLPQYVLLQKKLNGVRCTTVKKRNVVKLYSRGGKEYTKITDVLTTHLSHIMSNGEIWDGEIYVHGWSLERISQAVKRDKSKAWRKKVKYHVKKREWDKARWWVKTRNDTQRLEYHRYDLPSPWRCSKRLMNNIVAIKTDLVNAVSSYLILGNWLDVKNHHDKWVKEGYEGAIIRDPEAPYLWNGRGKRLMKYKEFIDEEFEIVGYKQGTGTDKGAVTWLCKGPDRAGTGYIHFDCRPRGTIEHRRWLYKNGKAYIGKMLTVRFFERSDKYVPIFPVGIVIRDYE
jgi:DNA ligase-1